MTSTLQRIFDQLERSHAGLLAAAESIPAEGWRRHPAPEAWSAGEVLAHLTMVETAVFNGAQKVFLAEPRPVPLWKRLHLPPRLAEYRLLKARTPIPLDPSLVTDKEAMLGRYREARGKTLEFMQANQERNLGRWRWPHPLFGSLDGYAWLRMLGYHEVRHTKQLREILRAVG